jgi:Pyridoxal-dependent decarboxylase conserved domain
MINQNVGAFRLSPLATEIEAQTVRWIAELIGYPAGCGGLLVSGGNMANFVCSLAARAAKAPWDVRTKGYSSDYQCRTDPLSVKQKNRSSYFSGKDDMIVGWSTRAEPLGIIANEP